jgi:type VI secretion system secreted protein VgrG
VSHALSEDTFGVVRFRGTEGFSMCYEFEIDLVSKNAEIDLTHVLKNPVTFTILRENGDIPFHGILAQFEQLQEVDEYVFYRAVLVPKLWWLSLTHHNQVLLNKPLPEIMREILEDGGLTALDFEFKLEKEYPSREYICQYRESHLNFVSRWMEREGMYYYFEQTDRGEKIIITDTGIAHVEMPQGKTMWYSQPSGLGEFHREELIHAFICRQKMLPRKLSLKDYNYRTPSLEISGSAEVSPEGRGNVYIYGEHFRTTAEGNALAKIRAEELLCQEKEFHGESTIPYLRPGYLFDLEDHYRGSFNQNYLTIKLEHEGSQTAFLLSGIQKGLAEVEEQSYYVNRLVAIPSDVQFRPQRKSEKPRFYGTINARIDAMESGKYAELDEIGRYKVILPFDLSGRKGGKASAWLRMAQPYGGTNHGMHFPLHRGTEVLLTFIDGDPDRPIIAGAVPNPETPSLVTSSDQTMSKITTSGGNKIHIEDKEDNQRILLHSPTQESYLRLGSQNDPADFWKDTGEGDGVRLFSLGPYQLNAARKSENIVGYSTSTVGGYRSQTTMGYQTTSTFGMKSIVTVGPSSATHLNGHNTYKTWKSAFIPFYNKEVSQETKLAGQITEMTGSSSKLEGEITKLQGELTTLSGEVTRLEGENTTLKGEITKLEGANTTLRGEVTKLTGGVTKLEGETTKLQGSVTDIQGEQTKLRGEVTRLDGESTSLAGSVSQIAGMISLM